MPACWTPTSTDVWQENGDVWGFAYEEDWISDPLADALVAQFEAGHWHRPAGAPIDRATRSAHLKMLRSIRRIVIEDMLRQVRRA